MGVKLGSGGRGSGYSPLRGLMESCLDLFFRGSWPGRLWECWPGAIEFRQVRRRLVLDGPNHPPLRAAFVSDLHIGPTTPVRLLKRVFRTLKESRPDLLLLGGDYVYLEAKDTGLSILTELVASVECPLKLAVLGNHDLWTDHQRIETALRAGGAQILVNESAQLPPPRQEIAVVGLDDPSTGHCDAATAFSGVNEEGIKIVLCHSPDGLLHLEETPFDLFLCGHTHGGQIATPWGPVVLPRGRLCRQFSSGFGRYRSGLVWVSRGVGGVEVPVRLFAPPDILILDL